jgi:hypothetical protein
MTIRMEFTGEVFHFPLRISSGDVYLEVLSLAFGTIKG